MTIYESYSLIVKTSRELGPTRPIYRFADEQIKAKFRESIVTLKKNYGGVVKKFHDASLTNLAIPMSKVHDKTICRVFGIWYSVHFGQLGGITINDQEKTLSSDELTMIYNGVWPTERIIKPEEKK